MKADVTILDTNLEVEYDYKITASGSPESWSAYGGDPAVAAEFEIEVLGIAFPKQTADAPELELPTWLKDMLTAHLYERDDINKIVQRADQERDTCHPDDERL